MFALIKLGIAVFLVTKIHDFLISNGFNGPVVWVLSIAIPFIVIIAWSIVSTPNVNQGTTFIPNDNNNNDSF